MEEFASAQGLAWKNMDRTNQTMLRYQYIMEKTALAQGDYQKPIDSWAVSSRNATNSISEMTGKLAVGLMPTIIKLADMVTDFAQRTSAWAEANKQLISETFASAVEKAMAFGNFLIGVIKTIWRFRNIIIITAAAIKTWQIVSAINIALKAFQAAQIAAAAATGATGAATGVATGAMLAFNAAIAANPIGAIVTGIVILVTAIIMLMIKLSKEVGGLGNAFKVVGQTIMKFLLTPINLAIDAIGGLLSAIGHIPGMDWAKTASASIKGFQDKMNITLTGSESTLTNSGIGYLADPYRNARSAELARQEAAAETAGDDDPMKETNGLLEKLLGKMDLEIEATEGLGKGSKNSPANLRWVAMGMEDFFEIQRLGI
jgi:hypothetical protein